MTKRVAMILADNFEDSEATSPLEALQGKGVEVDIIATTLGTVTGKHGAEVEATRLVNASVPDNYDLLVIPGGTAPETLRVDQAAVDFTRAFAASGKPVASICHGPQLLISAGVLGGRTITSVATIRDDVKNAGATYVDEEVHVDGNLISSRTPDDLDAFNAAIIEALNA